MSGLSLFPEDQETDTNVECPICLEYNLPIDDPKWGSTECVECEKAFHFRCVKDMETCPICKYDDKPIFKNKLSRMRKKELEGLSFKCFNFAKCDQILKTLDAITHVEECFNCDSCKTMTV